MFNQHKQTIGSNWYNYNIECSVVIVLSTRWLQYQLSDNSVNTKLVVGLGQYGN